MTSQRDSARHRHGAGGWPLLLLLGGGLLGFAATLFAVAGPLNDSGESQPSRYVEATVGAPSRVNPLFAYMNDVDRDIVSLVFSGLTRLAPDGEALPDLAESWETSEDGKAVTFHLRRGVRWHDGSPFKSEDVLFTYGLLANPEVEGDPEQAALWRQLTCTAPDEVTVTCQLPEAFAPFLTYAAAGILPKGILDGAEVGKRIFDEAFNSAPVGTGPFRLAELDQTHALLKANASYHLGRPPLDEVDLRFYPDTASAAAAIIQREADGLLLDVAAAPKDFQALTGVSGLKSYTLNRSAYTALYLNNSVTPLNQPSVRQAISRAVDVDAIISEIARAGAVRAKSPMAPGTWAFNPDVEAPGNDTGEARKILDEAGWKLPEGAQVRQRDGVELRVTLMTDQDPLRGAIADDIAKQLQKVGIEASVVRQASTNLVRDFLIPRAYQAAIFGWDPGPDSDPYPAWHSSQAAGNGRNLAAYANSNADKLMEEGRQTADSEKRRELYYSFQEMFLKDAPSIFLFYPVYTYFVSDEIKDVQPGTLFFTSSRFNNVHEWAYEKTPDVRGE